MFFNVHAVSVANVFVFFVGTLIMNSYFKCTNLKIHAVAFTPDDFNTLSPFTSPSQSSSSLDLIALEALYNSTNGEHWYDGLLQDSHIPVKWFESEDVCSWYGVLCNDQNRVQNITLEQETLVGSLPSEIGYLSHLINLKLRGDGISGTLPTELGLLEDLQYLRLYGTQINGSLPSEIGEMSSMRLIDIIWSDISGTIPTEIGNLENMVVFQIGIGGVSGSIPTEIGRMTRLKYFSLAQNEVQNLPTQFGLLDNLHWLYLYNNNINSTIPTELSNAENLIVLDLSNNFLHGTIPRELTTLQYLRKFNAEGNNLSCGDDDKYCFREYVEVVLDPEVESCMCVRDWIPLETILLLSGTAGAAAAILHFCQMKREQQRQQARTS